MSLPRAILVPTCVLALLFAIGCEEDGSNPQIRIELVDPSGENAALGIIEGRLRVRVRQGAGSLPCAEGACEADIRGGDFDLALPIESFEALTRIQADIDGGDELLLGAVPEFQVVGEGLETGEVNIRLVMLPRGRCAPLELFNLSSSGRPRLVTPRRDMAAVVRRNAVLLAGGVEEAGASARTDFFDQAVVEMRPPLANAPAPLGAARGIALDDDEDYSLVIGDDTFVWQRQTGPAAARSIVLHEGADFSSALARVGAETAVIGGTDTALVTWVRDRGIPITGRAPLTVRRSFAAAAAGVDGVLVVGGGPGGEWITPDLEVPSPVDGIPDGSGGWLAASPTRRSFLWIGAHGMDTTLIAGCPSACSVMPGPAWTGARDGASGVRTAAGVFWIVGGDDSDLIDRVVWDGEVPRIVEGPLTLVEPRAGAAVVEHASGIILVIGGEGPTEGMRQDVEMCMPDGGLDPL